MASGNLPSVVTEGGRVRRRCMSCAGFSAATSSHSIQCSAALPRLLRIRASRDRPEALGPLIDLIVAESRHRRAGRRSVLLRIGELLFVEVVRLHLATMDSEGRGWLAGLRDTTVGRALALMHREPQRKWTLEDLAHDAGTSRSVLAERFAHFVGETPMRYLAKWRLQRAAVLPRGGRREGGVCRAGHRLRIRSRVQPGVQEGDWCRAVGVEASRGRITTATTAIRPRITRTTRAFATARLQNGTRSDSDVTARSGRRAHQTRRVDESHRQ